MSGNTRKNQVTRLVTLRHRSTMSGVLITGLSHDQNFANHEALLHAFGKWKPEEGLTVHAFLGNSANSGGYVLMEAAESGAVQSFVSKFTYWKRYPGRSRR